MRQKFIFATAAVVCLAVVLAPVMANERTVDRYGDRSKTSKARGAEDAVDVHETFSPLTQSIATEARISGVGVTTAKASGMLAQAVKQEGDVALSMLHQVVQMDLPDTPEADKILSEAYRRLGDLYEGTPSKQVSLYGVALQHASDPVVRERLQSRIAALGGDVFDVAFNGPAATSTRDFGPDDTCPGSIAAPLGIGSPYSEVMNIESGDHNWRSFDVATSGNVGWTVRIETITDEPGTFNDDTDLTLWNACPEDGGVAIAFNDDGGVDFMSLINTDCLAGGTYYVEVGGFVDVGTADNFTLEIEVTGTCEVPSPDDFEPDDARDDANAIGHPTSVPQNANGWGRAKKEIQAHSIFPAGDVDTVRFDLTRNELNRTGTKLQFPTFFNGFDGSGAFDNPDTVIELLYGNEPNYGGRCNQPGQNFLPICFSDADCPDPLENPLPGFPPCIPIQLFNVPFGFENPLAINDDRGGGDFGSELLLCLPRNAPGATVLTDTSGGWLVRVSPFSASDVFAYEIQVKNEVTCNYEVEPNNGFLSATPLTLGDTVHGIFEYASTNPFQDADLFSWDVDEDSLVTFETFGYDSFAVDTGLELYVGPDDNGDFFDTGVADDDGGAGFLSKLEVIAPPASDLLGNMTADADYFLNVTSFFLNPNYPYTLGSAVAAVPLLETEPNNTCDTANNVSLGDRVTASISPVCDYDSYKLTLTANTFVSIGSPAGIDSAIEVRDCSDDSVLSCDDDSGPGLLPLVDGCLPPGDYCVRVRAFSSGSGAYDIEFNGTGGCAPTDPPDLTGDGAFTCLDFDNCP